MIFNLYYLYMDISLTSIYMQNTNVSFQPITIILSSLPITIISYIKSKKIVPFATIYNL